MTEKLTSETLRALIVDAERRQQQDDWVAIPLDIIDDMKAHADAMEKLEQRILALEIKLSNTVAGREWLAAQGETRETTDAKIIRLTHKIDITDEERTWLAHHNR